MKIRRRTQSEERSILASSKPAMRRGSLLSLGKERLPFYETGLVEVAIAGHVGAVFVPTILMIVVDLGKLASNLLAPRFGSRLL